MTPSNHRAVCPGSYDPITNGHVDVITRAAELFDEVVVGVVNLPIRKGKTLFSTEDRIAMVEESTAHLHNVHARPFASLVVEFARENDAKVMVKGLRAISDFEYEFEMNQLNRMQAADIESVYLMASPQYSFLSSSGIKELATFGADVSDLVPPHVAARLKEALRD
jgi:pantetheine-phosphate adenylyltransferase